MVALVVAGGEHDDAARCRSEFVGRVGVAARVHERINLPGDTVQITLQGLRRITIERIDQARAVPGRGRSRPAKETPADAVELDELRHAHRQRPPRRSPSLVDRIPDEVPAILKMNVSDPGRFADLGRAPT